MILRLVWRSLRFAPGRTLLMLGGYSLGVGVMVALLSIGDAMVEQSRDRDLIGGGDLAVLPAGIDLETVRTGGVSSLYFGIDLARFFYREVLAGPRLAGSNGGEGAVAAVAPWIDDALLYLRLEDGGPAVAASAGGQIPSAAAALGVMPDLRSGAWTDNEADRRWMAPNPDERLTEIDGFHAPPGGAAKDSTWAEWHYFNLLSPDGERWLYLTYLVGGDLRGGRWGGRLLATLVEAGREDDRVFEREFGPGDVDVAPGRVDVAIGGASTVRLEDGRYHLAAEIPSAGAGTGGPLRVDLVVEPQPHRYLPAVDISPGGFPSGYAVPVLRGAARGTICAGTACEDWSGGRAYHDHNWGTWSDVTWDWGQFQLGDWSIVYGGVNRDSMPGAPASTTGSRFLFAVDSLGLAAVLPVRTVEYELGADGVPTRLDLEAGRGEYSLRLQAEVGHVRTTAADPEASPADLFFQLRGPASVEGRLPVGGVSAAGDGFFETWQRRTRP
ncbi:MAG TPA: hypothetical protein VLA33_00020 [Gemmatimonadota bacterium]|nr:hypothetical protein [Gemmatimonadota bacterium]